MLYDLAALIAAFSIALSNLVAPSAIRHLGPVVFNCWRLVAALIVVVLLVVLGGHWALPSAKQLLALGASGVIGIVIADSCFYAALARLGPRQTSVIYTSWAPFAAVLGYLLLGETLSLMKVAGIGAVIGGVALAIICRPSAKLTTVDEGHGTSIGGVVFGLAAAAAAAGAVLIARPVMAAGVDPATATAVRAAVGLLGLFVMSRLPGFHSEAPTIAVALRSATSGVLGMGVGMTLVLFALSGQPVGIVSTLSSTTPVAILPLLWMTSGVRPPAAAWAGAALAVAGVAVIAGGY
ncbi:putative permease of the drug/metabolite transporter (DMT) superfamily [Bradyrhizobium sp. STM 3843]|uniref:DMT family transporter n=1 Tax=Bradyrhizobium sp. STM 3843 TaxID=551947 RepID=UPI0002403061|nr:DMT family transporter [Bradyrhizobium sp. STM 3843]CCE08249.1 putative permease of the drug/metabolite transporter (DMT) superfamily [Bradyrhizobium sp. STM 3843]